MRGSRRRWMVAGLASLSLVGGLLGGDPLPVSAAPSVPPTTVESPTPPTASNPPSSGTELAAAAVDAPAVGGPGEYQYDAAGRLVGVVQNATQAARYTYDPAGNITGVSRYAASQLAVVSVVPASVRPGASVSVRGTGFPSSGAVVKFNGTAGTVTASSATALTVTVPSGVTAGPLTVTSGTTTVTGPSYAVAAPGPTVTAVSPTTGPPGTVVTLTGTGFRTEPANNVVSFNGIRAEVVGVTATSMTVAVPLTASSGRVEVATPAGSTRWSGDFTVPPAGVDPALIESSRRIAVGSAPVTVPVSAGKVALVLFDAPAQKRINLGFGAITFTNYVDADLYDSKGRKLKSAYGSSPFQLDAYNLTAGATYQLVLDPSGTTSGQVAVSVSEPQTAALSTTAAGAPVTFNRIGQDFAGALSAQAGQRLTVGVSASTMTSYSNLSVFRPDGSVLVSDEYVSGATSVRFTADVTGTYAVLLSPVATATGSMTITASVQIAAGALSPTGPGGAASLARPGQTAAWTFTGTAGQSANLGLTDNTLTSAAYVQVLAPDGSSYIRNEYVGGQSSASVPMDALPATGTYTVLVEPLGAATGAVTLTYSSQINAGTLTVTGAATPVTIGRAGQGARGSFAATLGQPLTLAISSNTLTKYAYADVYGPDGTKLVSEYVSAAADGVARFTPKVTGTHTLRIRPNSAGTGTFSLTLATRASAGALSTSAAGTTATAGRAGQDVGLTLTAAVGQNLSVGLTANTFPKPVYAYLYAPDGTKVSGFAEYLSAGADATTRLPAITTAGTYTLVLEAQYAVTGALTVTLSNDVAAGALTTGGAAKPITFSRPGQASRLTFSGTAGQTVKLNYSGLASGYYAECWVYPPTGAAIVNSSFLAGSGTVTVPALTATGTYQVVLAPYRPTAGSMSVSLVNAPAAIRADGSPTSARQQQAAEKSAQTRSVRRPKATRPVASTSQWRPDRTNLRGQDWVTRRATAPSVKNLRAAAGTTAVTGHVLTLDGKPLAAVTVKAGAATTKTDRRGRFLLRGVSPTTKTVIVDGASASKPGARYGLFRIRIEVREGRTNALPATVWMPRLDTEHLVQVGAPTVGETVLTTPEIPGLEVRIPAGSVIRDLDGKVVTELGITPIPLDRPPYPLPTNGIVPVFFTVQPGGAAVFPKGAQVIYPNYTKLPPGQVV
ncbi:MAG TPA: IPT/TIG domain-containing protein, partial [Propionibacteriaceae bacterium]